MDSAPNNLLTYAAKVASELLLCKDYITVPLPMANLLGLERAVLLKTIDNWCNSNETRESPNHFKNGHYWTYGSYEEWAKRIPCLGSARSIQRLFLSLEQEGLLISDVLNSFKGDRRKWYRVNHQKLGMLYLAEAEKQSKEAETQAQSIVPKVDDGHTKTGTTIVPKVDDGSAKSGCSNTKTYNKDIKQRLDSLSEGEREKFFKFVQDQWKKTTGQDIISLERFLAKQSDFDNWHQKFLASRVGQFAQQEALDSQYDLDNDPKLLRWLHEAYEGGYLWTQEDEDEKEERTAFYRWAQRTNAYRGRIADEPV